MSHGDDGATDREEKERKGLYGSGGGWITSRKTCRKEDCNGTTHRTRLNGGVSYEPSTTHKSGKGCQRRMQRQCMRTYGESCGESSCIIACRVSREFYDQFPSCCFGVRGFG